MPRIRLVLSGIVGLFLFGLTLLGLDVAKLPFCADYAAQCRAAPKYIAWAGLISIALGGGAYVVDRIISAWMAFQMWRDIRKYGKGEFYLEVAKLEELQELYHHYRDLFPAGLVPIETFRSWVERYPDMVWKVMRKPKGSAAEMVGFFDIEPLTASGREKMREQGIDAAALTPEDIWSPQPQPRRTAHRSTRPSAFYIGSVGSPRGTNKWVKTATTAYLVKKLHNLAVDGAIEVFTRPTTDEGLELVTKRQTMTKCWEDTPDIGSMWVCHFKRGQKVPEEVRRIARRLRLTDIG